ncbi:Amino acid permease [Hyella patelloides LEGE 07179]|uniref:Amino acid permease n=1 Tax=Hyella patelloides LEGE 07179 TaxID=945734 RepID=A0A563VZH7_9CYAN|nr:amino acid permease [Hyella patelloides]VEP16841.1 Amino acid permease [Hyella patelloides LEGE 07179]
MKNIRSSKLTLTKPTLTVLDAVALIVGMVIGAGIFETPALVAMNAGSSGVALLIWFLGGAISLVGTLCYAELATAYPHPGGSYYYFQRAFGNNIAFLFAWARLTVMQTGSIVLLAFVFGDYASEIYRLGDYSSSMYAAIAIILFSGLNFLGIKQGKWMQNCLALAQVLGLLLVIVVGLVFSPSSIQPEPLSSSNQTNLGLALVFVLLTYGGWNEAAHISAELRNVRRNMSRSLLWSIGAIALLYLLINFAYLHGLGFSGTIASKAVAADLMRTTIGSWGVVSISLLVAVATLCSLNATIFTGARTNYALGNDFRLFAWLGHWETRRKTPTNALLVQCAIALLLVLLGTLTRNGFETMVEYTTPVFWFFFLLTGISLFVLRMREPEVTRPFQVPFYPLTPILFCGICIYMLQSSLIYTGVGAIVGVVVLLAGVPLWLQMREVKRN